MSLADEMNADFFAIHEDLPSFVDIGGVHIAALVDEGTLSEELELGGFAPVRSVTVKLRRCDMTLTPKVGDLLYYSGYQYRIDSINTKKSVPLITLQCRQL